MSLIRRSLDSVHWGRVRLYTFRLRLNSSYFAFRSGLILGLLVLRATFSFEPFSVPLSPCETFFHSVFLLTSSLQETSGLTGVGYRDLVQK